MLLWLCLLCSLSPTAAAKGTPLDYRVYEDTTRQLTCDAVQALPDTAFSHHHGMLSKGYTRSAFWMLARVPAARFQGQPLWLQLDPVYVDQLTLHLRAPGETSWRVHRLGRQQGGDNGDLDYRFPVFRLQPPENSQGAYEIAVRVQSRTAILVEPSLWRTEALLSTAATEIGFWSFYLGLAALATLLTLLLALVLRTRLLWATFAFSSNYLLVAEMHGFVDWQLTGTGALVASYLSSAIMLISFASIFWLLDEALNLRRQFPRVHRLTLGLIALALLSQLSIPLDIMGPTVTMLTVLGGVMALVLIGCAVCLLRRRGIATSTLGLAVAAVVWLVFGIAALLTGTGMIGYSASIYALWQYATMGIMLTVVVFAVLQIQEFLKMHAERQRLQMALEDEQAARRRQRQLMAMVSHEFRTPLALMDSAMENLYPHLAGDARAEKRYRRVEVARDWLLQLTDNCLTENRLEDGSLMQEPRPVDLGALVDDVVLRVQEVAHRHAITVTVERPTVGEATAPRMMGDAGMLAIALTNLVDNAVKYSPPGPIKVSLTPAGNFHRIAVQDCGPGIPEADVARVFDPYQRASSGDEATRAGVGLGLYIARQIARQHGGDLVLAANRPRGCRFELLLPALTAPRNASATKRDASTRG